MKITGVEAIPFRIPMKRVEHFATGSILSLDHVLVRIETDEGLVGHAEAPPRSMIYGESIARLPLHRLLGGWTNDVELTYILGLGTPEEVAEQALGVMAEHGIRTFK